MSNRIHVFAVAVERYQREPTIKPVAYAENDAREFVKAWQDLGAVAGDCMMLLSAQATKTAVESSFKKFLNGISKGDTVVFFFAGHGVAFNEMSYLTAHDTQPGDLKATCIALAAILQQLRECKSDKVMIFIDACESGLPITGGMRTITGNFSGEELKQFCSDAEHHIGFAACKVTESSWPSSTLKHGIWSSCVIRALRGDEKGAVVKGSLVTSDSLRDFLAVEVPRLLRETRSGNETQTPCCFGNSTKQFIVADLSKVLAGKAAKEHVGGAFLKHSVLRGESSGNVRSLTGFRKGYHRVPKGHFSAAETFLQDMGADDVKTQADSICENIRKTFGFKRKEINYGCADGYATIKTPDFDVNIWITQDPSDAAAYVITTEVGVIRRPQVVFEDKFSDVFSQYCNSIVITFSRELDLEQKIDEIEDTSELKDHFDYEPDCSSFTLALPQITIYVTSERMTLALPHQGTVKALLKNTESALKELTGAGISLLLPQKTQ